MVYIWCSHALGARYDSNVVKPCIHLYTHSVLRRLLSTPALASSPPTRCASEAYHGGSAILRQGAEVDRVVFVKSGFCNAIRELHPRHHDAYGHFVDKHRRRGDPERARSVVAPLQWDLRMPCVEV